MPKDKRSFFERLTGSVSAEEESTPSHDHAGKIKKEDWLEGTDEGQLTVDVFQTPDEIIIQSTIAGVKPEDLDISITQDMVTIKGTRRKDFEAKEDNYYYRELYWGKFARSILISEEIDADEAEATIKNGLLTIRLPKIDKDRTHKIKIKNS
ncbi:MAG: Hsp20/alpha crystallin family protein [Patescibacteria group bacterium]